MGEVPDAAIEAAAEALGHDDDCTQVTLEIGCNCDLDDRTRAAIEAAMPAIRDAIRAEAFSEVVALIERDTGYLDAKPHKARGWIDDLAARIVRGGAAE